MKTFNMETIITHLPYWMIAIFTVCVFLTMLSYKRYLDDIKHKKEELVSFIAWYEIECMGSTFTNYERNRIMKEPLSVIESHAKQRLSNYNYFYNTWLEKQSHGK